MSGKTCPADRHYTLGELAETCYIHRSLWTVEFRSVQRLCRVGGYVLREVLMKEFLDMYGVEWRVWPRRPSDEAREASPWQGPAMDGRYLERVVRAAMRPYNDLARGRWRERQP